MTEFVRYTDAVLAALKFNTRSQDVIAKKQEILDSIYHFHNLVPTSVLFVGFNPSILSCRANQVAVTEISDEACDYLDSLGVVYTRIDNLENYKKQFECVVAAEEYFTFANTPEEQQAKIGKICSLATDFVISTLRDYKNQDYKDREFSQPALVRNGNATKVFVEWHNWDQKDRTAWQTNLHEIAGPENTLVNYGTFNRHTMYFKQLAKFSMDAGACDFLVHKNLMYKSLIKKNYEHVISIRFENGY